MVIHVDFHDQIVAIKLLNLKGLQGKHEFLIEVLMLSTLHHPHLVSLMGYCNDGDQRLLVYEYMPKGSLENHLFGNPCQLSLDLVLVFIACSAPYSNCYSSIFYFLDTCFQIWALIESPLIGIQE